MNKILIFQRLRCIIYHSVKLGINAPKVVVEGGCKLPGVNRREPDDSLLTSEIRLKIERFLTKKRYTVLTELGRQGELTQKELANAIKSTATSLSNILLRFEECPYQLIQSRNGGKFRYYQLTDLGRAYWEAREDINKEDEDSKANEMALQLACKSLGRFKELYIEFYSCSDNLSAYHCSTFCAC